MSWELVDFAQMASWLVSNVANFLLILTIAFRVWVVLWIAKDVSLRTNSFAYQLFSILIGLIPIVGYFVYLLIRPPFFLKDDGYWRESLELQSIVCKQCDGLNLREWDKCGWCGATLKVQCKECKNLVWNDLEYCTWCGAPLLIEENGKKN